MEKTIKLTKNIIYLKTKNSNLSVIKSLNIPNSNLSDLSILKTMPNLQIISFPSNKIKTLKYFENLSNLKELNLNNNLINDINEINYLKNCPKLNKISLKENPINSLRGYRYYIINFIPNIKNIDGIIISKEEKEMAMSFKDYTKL